MSKYIKLKLFHVQYDDDEYDIKSEQNRYSLLFEQSVGTTRETVCGPYTINKNGLMCMSSVS